MCVKLFSITIGIVVTLGIFWAIGVRASEIPWVESECSERTDISFVRPVTLSSLLNSLEGKRTDTSPTPVIAAMLSKVDPFDKELNIGEWVSACSLDELDK